MHRPVHLRIVLPFVLLAMLNGSGLALELPKLFSDGAVLQRGIEAPVWGKAEPGAKVTVDFAHHRRQTVADADGRWRVTLPPLRVEDALGGGTLMVATTGESVVIEDVVVGEVWLCSGQSNMGFRVSLAEKGEDAIASAGDPEMRLFTVTEAIASEPMKDIGGRWQRCTPETVATFSAVGYFFGRTLRRELGVPVGLLHSSRGGTRIEAWVSGPMLDSTPAARPFLQYYEKAADGFERRLADYASYLARYREDPRSLPRFHTDPGLRGSAKGYHEPDFDDSAWATVELPSEFTRWFGDLDGVVWYRQTVALPEAWRGEDLRLTLGAIDDFDITYFNGQRVGATTDATDGWWEHPRDYRVPGECVEGSRATIAVRVFDRYGGGGFLSGASQMRLSVASDEASAISLAGHWRAHVERRLSPLGVTGMHRRPPSRPFGPGSRNQPAGLFNGMISPLIPFGLAGVAWYQGESNTGVAESYREIFPAMIEDWRSRWGRPNLPFLFVQLPGYGPAIREPRDPPWARLRDAQLHTFQTVPHTAMAVTIDAGDANDVHPRNKQIVADRLARFALRHVYGFERIASGPVFRSMRVEGDRAVVTFDRFGDGIKTRDNEPLAGFTIAGPDKRFVRARARIEGDAVVVWSTRVPRPVAVRYAWAANPVEANLVGESGLPASPFRTDDW